MTTYDYELLALPPAKIAAEIRDDNPRCRIWLLSGEELAAMLGWAQHEQDHLVYERCFAERERREQFGDPDAVPCSDCGVLLLLAVPCYAIDCGGVCAPCARARYGDRASEYLIA